MRRALWFCVHLFLSLSVAVIEKDDEDDSTEVIPDYSQLRTTSAIKLTPLEDVNTHLYVGTEVIISTSKSNIKHSFTASLSFIRTQFLIKFSRY